MSWEMRRLPDFGILNVRRDQQRTIQMGPDQIIDRLIGDGRQGIAYCSQDTATHRADRIGGADGIGDQARQLVIFI